MERERDGERERGLRFNNTFIDTFLLHNSIQYDHQSDHILIMRKRKPKNTINHFSQIKNKLIILQHT